jgi:hypothetical protein
MVYLLVTTLHCHADAVCGAVACAAHVVVWCVHVSVTSL